MTAEQHQTLLLKKLNGLKNMGWLLPLVNNVHNDMLRRIFTDGISSNNEKIGDYSSRPLYAPGKVFARPGAFLPRGKKNIQQVFKNGKLRKTMYLPQGYRQLRQIQGLGAGSVNLTYTGNLQQDFSMGLLVEDDCIVLKLNTAVNQNKLTWLKKKYGDSLFQHTQQEKEKFIKAVTEMLTDYLSASS